MRKDEKDQIDRYKITNEEVLSRVHGNRRTVDDYSGK
jgi:hypothetical protein